MTRPKALETGDYKWRISMKKADFAKLAACLARQITYSISSCGRHGRKIAKAMLSGSDTLLKN
jgi:hypothetical protein